MRELSQEEYESWRCGAEVTASDQHGDKVLLLGDGAYLKLFRIKRLLTSALFFPYWRRFVRNAGRLTELGVPTLRVREIYRIPHLARTAVHYDPLVGMTLRELPDLDADLVRKLGRFLTILHERGIYLRSLHFGNVVLTPEGELGLIDIADMRIRQGPLSRRLRVRNYRHLCRYDEDRVRVAAHADEFLLHCDPAIKPRIVSMLGP
mgnify:CR=1 FL=1